MLRADSADTKGGVRSEDAMGGWTTVIMLVACAVGVLAFLHVFASELDRTTRIREAQEAYEKRLEERRRVTESEEKRPA